MHAHPSPTARFRASTTRALAALALAASTASPSTTLAAPDFAIEPAIARLVAESPTAVVERAPLGNAPVGFHRLRLETSGATAEARVRDLIARHPVLVGGVSEGLVFSGTSEARGMVVARFVETHDGLPVEGAELVVTLDEAGHATRVRTSVKKVDAVLAPTISDEAAAVRAVERALGVAPSHVPPFSVVIAARPDGTHVRAVKVVVARPGTFDARSVLVDTASGEVLSSSPATVR